MAHLDIHSAADSLDDTRRHARQTGQLQHVQIMLAAAGITAVSIVVVAATVMTTLL
ncbi:hypothetical protein [Devosia alba]|uniref:hypothetical protein n=1 Tax=Devosia alba TaxID=3152360 RepID=UPI003267ACB2